MNIYQAAKAVAEGRAKDARRLICRGGVMWMFEENLLWMLKEDLIDLADLIATDWELVGEKPRTERVEVKRMYCPECHTVMTIKEHQQNNCCKNAVELTGHYDRPIPEEVTEFETVVLLNKLSTEPVPGGWITDLPAAWIGKKVRVELI